MVRSAGEQLGEVPGELRLLLVRKEGLCEEEAFKGSLADVEELILASTRAKYLVKGLLCSYAPATHLQPCMVWS